MVGPDELSGIEAGRRRPDADAVARLAETYGCSVQDLVPPRQPLDPAVFDGLSDAEILKHYLAMVRTWRETERPQCFRADDLQTLVGILGTDVTLIEGKIRALTGCSRKTAKWFRRLFVLGLAASAGALLYQGSAAAAGDSAGESHPAPATTAGVAAHNPALRAPVVCHSPSVTTAPVPSGTSRPGAVVKVSVAVMAYVDIQLDSTGTPVAVRPHGQRPRLRSIVVRFRATAHLGRCLGEHGCHQPSDELGGWGGGPARCGSVAPRQLVQHLGAEFAGRHRFAATSRRSSSAACAPRTCSVETSPRPLLPVRWAFQHEYTSEWYRLWNDGGRAAVAAAHRAGPLPLPVHKRTLTS